LKESRVGEVLGLVNCRSQERLFGAKLSYNNAASSEILLQY
jgi:hypothetical protein